MSVRTALTEPYSGLLERMCVPVELQTTAGGQTVARFGTTLPVHCASADQVARLAETSHHYVDVFTEQLLAPLTELVYVRLDENTVEKVFVNRTRRLLLTSSDGRLAQWRCVPTFESRNRLLPGTPVVDQSGALVSVVTARRHHHYALSAFDGEGGYFDTSLPWRTLDAPPGKLRYGDRWFESREQLRAHVAALGPPEQGPAQPVLHRGAAPRVSLVAAGGRQLCHVFVQGALVDDIQYL